MSLEAAPGAVCLVSANPTPENTAGCAAVLFDGRASASGWPGVGRPARNVDHPGVRHFAPKAAPLREKLAAGGKVRVSFALEAKSGNDAAETVVATLPGKDHSKYILFCAHGDSDSGGPGANDNASGVAIVLEIARAVAAAVKAGRMPSRPGTSGSRPGAARFRRRASTYAMDKDPSKLQAVFNYDQSGFGSSKDALYVEPDDVAVNKEIITLIRSVMKDHLGKGISGARRQREEPGRNRFLRVPEHADAGRHDLPGGHALQLRMGS